MEGTWKKTKLSLERPYKDDHGNLIPALLDITSEGEHIYESKEIPSARLKENLRRIFVERGIDFLERTKKNQSKPGDNDPDPVTENADDDDDDESTEGKETSNFMDMEELAHMRMEIVPQLFVALGEMSHARDLLTSILSSSNKSAPSSSSLLSATLVNKLAPVVEVQGFNAQLSIGGKDEALRKASSVFKTAAESMERGRIKGEKYWIDALKIRRGNWGLLPAPLPYGSATGKGVDRTTKDFVISYGLEESPTAFRRRAIGHIASHNLSSNDLVFPHRQHSRLRVSITVLDDSGVKFQSCNRVRVEDHRTLEGNLRNAQKEIIDQEIFTLLVNESGNLPTASSRVAETSITVDAALGIQLVFDLVNDDTSAMQPSTDGLFTDVCDLIYNCLHILLLRRHDYEKQLRLGASSRTPFAVLQPVIDVLQYHVLLKRIGLEIRKFTRALTVAGIPSVVSFDAVGETGKQLVNLFSDYGKGSFGGEAIFRIDDRHTIRLTFLSPVSLTAHLSQATLAVSSVPQLCQLLMDEMEKCLLLRICNIGESICLPVGGTWFIDLNRCVGRWDGCVLNFRILFGKDFSIDCSVFRLDSNVGKQGKLLLYSLQSGEPKPLLSWVETLINESIAR